MLVEKIPGLLPLFQWFVAAEEWLHFNLTKQELQGQDEMWSFLRTVRIIGEEKKSDGIDETKEEQAKRLLARVRPELARADVKQAKPKKSATALTWNNLSDQPPSDGGVANRSRWGDTAHVTSNPTFQVDENRQKVGHNDVDKLFDRDGDNGSAGGHRKRRSGGGLNVSWGFLRKVKNGMVDTSDEMKGGRNQLVKKVRPALEHAHMKDAERDSDKLHLDDGVAREHNEVVGDAFTSLYANPLGNRVSIDRAFLNELCDDDDKDGGRTEGLSDASIFGKLLIAADPCDDGDEDTERTKGLRDLANIIEL